METRKMVQMRPFAAVETQTDRLVDTEGAGEGGTIWKSIMET